MSGFIKFTGSRRSYAAKVSIWKRGQMNFNLGAIEKFGLGEFGFVVLYYDPETRRIGLQFTTDAGEEGAIKFRAGKNGAVISAKPFMDLHGISYDSNETFDIVADQDAGIKNFFVVDLNRKPEPEQGNLLGGS